MAIKISDPVTFNGRTLNSVTGWTTTATDTYRYPTRDVSAFNLSYRNGSVTTEAFFSGRPITVSGIISVPSRDALDESISKLKGILRPINKTLSLPVSGVQRIFKNVTVRNIIFSDFAGGYGQVDIEFLASVPYSLSTTTTQALNVVNNTSGDKSYPVTFIGTATQVPVFTLTLDSVTGGTGSRSVKIENPLTGDYIEVERSWTAAEVLVIDCENRTVTVDGDTVDFFGRFPEWEEGAGFINYTDTFTARQIDIVANYTQRYE